MEKMILDEKCFLCGGEYYSKIHEGVRGNSDIDVLKCNNCGLVRLSSFIQNTDNYYKNSRMRPTKEDFKKILIKASEDDERRFDFVKKMAENKSVMDFGCGAGGFLTRIKGIASNIYGVELEDEMRKHIIDDGITCFSSIDDAEKKLHEKMDIITMWHVLEHLSNPVEYLERLSSLLNENGRIIIEVPNAEDALISQYDCKAFEDFTYWECHLYLYSTETLKKLIKIAGLKCQFITQVQRYPLSNHLYWLTQGKPGGHVQWAMLNDEQLDTEYGKKLANLGIADTIIAVVER